jgi:hypothetical protein
VIVLRSADARFPFLWEDTRQPPARWHSAGEAPVAYFAETPDGAWAEFLRHEEIVDADDPSGVSRTIWAVELPRLPKSALRLPVSVLSGGRGSYPACQAEARRLRWRGRRGLVAPSAALAPESPSGYVTGGGLMPASSRRERVFVRFGRRPELIGWAACDVGRPRADLLRRVRSLD